MYAHTCPRHVKLQNFHTRARVLAYRSNVDAALQALLTEAIASAAPLLRPSPRKPPLAPTPVRSPSPSPSPSFPEARQAPPTAHEGSHGAPAAGARGTYNNISALGGAASAEPPAEGSGQPGGAPEGSGTRSSTSSDHSTSSTSSQSQGGGSEGREQSPSVAAASGEAAGAGGAGPGATVGAPPLPDARMRVSTQLLQLLLDELLLDAVGLPAEQADQSRMFGSRAALRPPPQQRQRLWWQSSAGVAATPLPWQLSASAAAQLGTTPHRLQAPQRLWLARCLAESVAAAVASTSYFPAKHVCQAIVQVRARVRARVGVCVWVCACLIPSTIPKPDGLPHLSPISQPQERRCLQR